MNVVFTNDMHITLIYPQKAVGLKYILSISTLLLIVGCNQVKETIKLPEVDQKPTTKQTVSLNSEEAGDWTLYFGLQDENAPHCPTDLKKSGFQRIDATVPGNVEIDLQREGIIEDPMVGTNVWDLREYESYQWWYHRSFGKPEIGYGERVELCFDGIDCIADIWLNGRKIARVENMFVEHHFDVTDLLKEHNELYICIYSTVLEARKYTRNNLGVRYDALAEAVSIRKAPHMFGWDILPRLISAGLWRDVKLEIIPPTYWESVYWVTKKVDVEAGTADMYVDWQFNTDRLNVDDLMLNISLSRGNSLAYEKSIPVFTTVARERIWGIRDVDFWWPRGFGEPALYEARLQLLDKEGHMLCENVQHIGIRTADLDLTQINTEEKPGEFVFKINGEKVFVKGTNWVALDALHSRDNQHLDTAVNMLVDLNCNMIRLWGGNVYESDRFYDLCDQHGIMVWQDFTMGCTTYPQDADFSGKVRVEAEKVLRRLRNHPSIVLWAGNNENDVSLDWEGDQSRLDPNKDVISRMVLPGAVREWDPKTAYLPSSPFISTEVFNVDKKINTNLSPEMHLWGPRGYYKAPFYTQNKAKFVSEIGYHGAPNRESLEKMMEADFVYPWITDGKEGKPGRPVSADGSITSTATEDLQWNEQWQCKATCTHPNTEVNKQRNHLMTRQINAVFGKVPTDLDRFIQASQIVQAEAVKYFIEFWRMNKWDRNGILWWNLRDGWPVVSDAIVDYYGGKKLAYHYIKRVQTDVCVMIGDPQHGNHPVVAVNDTREEKRVDVMITEHATGRVLMRKNVTVPSNGNVTLGNIPGISRNELWLIEYKMDGETYRNHYVAYQPPMDFEQYEEWLSALK